MTAAEGTSATHLCCDDCRSDLSLDSLVNLCPRCGGLLEVQYDLSAVPADLATTAAERWREGMWRWGQLLPLPRDAQIVTLGEGDSPLIEATRLGARVGVHRLLIKNDGVMPTGSFKDRGFALAVSFAKHHGAQSGFTYSSGNAGASFAAYCARAGIAATVFVESIANEAKVAAIGLLGADVYRLRFESSTHIFDTLDELSRAGHCSFVNFVNPIRHEAMKVYAYEICEALGWQAPEVMIHPVGTGGGLWGAWKGFLELRELGLIDRVPRMVGVQPSACAPLVDAFEAGRSATRSTGDPTKTMAQSIAADDMIHGGRRVLRALRESGGRAVAVSEEEIAEAMRQLGAEGVPAEPSAAVTVAALTHARAEGWASSDDTVVAVVTGQSLKQPSAVMAAAPAPLGDVTASAQDWLRVLARGKVSV